MIYMNDAGEKRIIYYKYKVAVNMNTKPVSEHGLYKSALKSKKKHDIKFGSEHYNIYRRTDLNVHGKGSKNPTYVKVNIK